MSAVGPDLPASLDLQGVTKSFPTADGLRPVLTGVDLSILPGELVVLAGRSGSGKTTLLSIIVGWDSPDRGTVHLLDGIPARDCRWAQLAVVPQSLGLLDELTIIENITLPARLDDRIDAAVADALVERLGLTGLVDRHPNEVSLGEQQRAALARAAAVAPAILVADEPIAHQNQAWAEVMMEVVVDLQAQGTACLLATHNEIAFRPADRIVTLVDGRLTDH